MKRSSLQSKIEYIPYKTRDGLWHTTMIETLEFKNMNKITREICKKCGIESCIGFDVPNEVWNKAVKGRWNVLCIQCFDEICDESWEDFVELYPVSKTTFNNA